MAIRRFDVDVTGTSPLLLSNNACSDPLSDAAKTKKFFTSKRTKSDDDHRNLRVIDWVYSGYWKKPGEVVIDNAENTVDFNGFANLFLPSQNFQRCLVEGAKAFKLGKEVNRALVVEEDAEKAAQGGRRCGRAARQPMLIARLQIALDSSYKDHPSLPVSAIPDRRARACPGVRPRA